MSETRQPTISTFEGFARAADYSLMRSLDADPDATADGDDRRPRQVFSGHFVPVDPTALPEPAYVAHSPALFSELGLSDDLVHDDAFRRVFSGDLSAAQAPMRRLGWATGYALSIYGTEYVQQCPFGTGNGYGDGRAISVFEGVFAGKRWEMQLKGGGPTPYCRGADGRAVLRSSVREFLAQEHMHALGVPTSRSLTLYVSKTETVRRPWYSPQSRASEPDIFVDNPAAISTRVAPSFLRVGQLELFARRARKGAHPRALEELRQIVLHLIEREYAADIDADLPFEDRVVALAATFRARLISLVAHWLRVGYCQGNFNSDNCAAGGFTLDYGPFGFCEQFDPVFQPWIGGGRHFSFFNQPVAAAANFHSFCTALSPLLEDDPEATAGLEELHSSFAAQMEAELQSMWATKLGLSAPHPELVTALLQLMLETKVDYTMLFRALCDLPEDVSGLKRSFYGAPSRQLEERWQGWLLRWRERISTADPAEVSARMKRANPKYTWREWLVVPAYERAMQGDYALVHELHEVLRSPYDEQSPQTAAKYDQRKPEAFFNAGGVSHYSCSS
ncbi:MAG: protein adenylyltransferase SelO [Nannocystaceae bacterium]|nr:protein adenylyltransferase SelO family protein [bacterium]